MRGWLNGPSEEISVVGDPGIEPGVRLREGVTVPCHTLRPVAHRHRDVRGVTAEISPASKPVNGENGCKCTAGQLRWAGLGDAHAQT